MRRSQRHADPSSNTFSPKSARAAWALAAAVACLPGLPQAHAAAPPKGAAATAPVVQELITEPVYDGGLKGKWQDQGWAPRDTVAGQAARLDFADLAGWILVRSGPVAPATSLVFRVQAPPSFGDFLEVHLGAQSDDNFPRVAIGPQHRHRPTDEARPDWQEVRLPLSELNPRGLPFDRFIIRARRSVPSAWVELSQIGFASAADAANLGALPFESRRISLQVDGTKPGRSINPLIYGIAFNPRKNATDAYQWNLGASARRWGGNPASRYNWRLGNAWNTAADWFFMNVNYTGVPNYSWTQFLGENESHATASAITLPMLGWVAKDTHAYSYPVSVYGPQRGHYGSTGDVGNGMQPDGRALPGADPRRTSVPAPPSFAGEWVSAIANYQADHPQSPGVAMYFLDNEPALWNSTHQDIHPQPVTYDELVTRSIATATEVRRADPNARIAGPSEWGWPAYFFSGADAAAGFGAKPDRLAHHDTPLLAYYLKAMHDAHDRSGARMLNLLDVHFYPEAEGVHGGRERFDEATAAKRIRSTRALWDPTYKDESWIADTVKLIPRLRQLVSENYPGLGLSLGEYNFGGERHMSGGLAQALALGRFGQHGLDAAFYWTYPPEGSPVFHAFRAFRNYDGQGGHFLERSLPTVEDRDVSIFASTNADHSRIVAVAVNANPHEGADADLDVTGPKSIGGGRLFQYRGQPQGLEQVGDALPKTGLSSLRVTLPPYSITVVELQMTPR